MGKLINVLFLISFPFVSELRVSAIEDHIKRRISGFRKQCGFNSLRPTVFAEKNIIIGIKNVVKVWNQK
jgi:hypothetical protein